MRTIRILANGYHGLGSTTDLDGAPSFTQDADETLDYTLDWTGWLRGDTIASSTWTASAGTLALSTSTTKTASTFLSAVSARCELTNTIVTAGGRTKEFAFRVYEKTE